MELRTYLEIILSRKWIVIQAMVIVSLTAYLFTSMQTSVYKATAKMFIKGSQGESLFPDSAMQWWSDPNRSLQTQMQLIKSKPVAEKVVKNLGLEMDAESLAGSISAEPVKDADVIELSITDTIPERARDTVNEYAEQYIYSRREASISQLSLAIRQLRAKIEDVKTEQLELAKELADKDDTLKGRLESELAFNNQLYMILAEKHEMLKVDQTLKKGGAELYEPASVPRAPINATPYRNGVTGLVAGLLLGVGIVFLLEHLDNTIKNPDDVLEHYGLPAIGQIPSREFESEKWSHAKSLVISLYPKSSTSEAYRGLRNNLKFINHNGDIRSIMVTSALPGEGKTTTVANLAAALAETGYRVIAICCDLRRPTLHKIFGLSNDIGTSNVLIGDLSVDDVLKDTEIPGLQVIPSGPVPPVPSDIFSSPNMLKMVEECKERASYVIIDTPPALAVTDSVILTSVTDGVIVMTNAGKTTFEAVKQFKSIFEKTGAKLLGVVLNNIDTVRQYGSYYYYYSYGYKNPYVESGVSENGAKKRKRKVRG